MAEVPMNSIFAQLLLFQPQESLKHSFISFVFHFNAVKHVYFCLEGKDLVLMLTASRVRK